MKKLSSYLLLICIYVAMASSSSCEDSKNSDTIQRKQQEVLLADATAAVGMPAVPNHRERRIMKDIIERRDQEGLLTYTYVFSEITGKYTFIGETIGYGIPYATQFTNPQKVITNDDGVHLGQDVTIMPQADPNGLFSPASAEGTWIMMYDPVAKKAAPQYIESRISVFTFKLSPSLVIAGY